MRTTSRGARTPSAWLLGALLSAACAGDAATDPGDPRADPPAATASVGAADVSDVSDASDVAGDPGVAGAAGPADAADEPAPFEPVPWPAGARSAHKVLYAGSWSVKPPEGFERAWIDEAGLRETFTKRQAGRRRWAGLATDAGPLPIDELLRDREGPAAAYVYALVQRQPLPIAEGAPIESGWPDREAVLHVRHRGRLRAWFDGEVVVDAAPPDEPGAWRHSQAPVRLTKGFDVLLLKLGRGSAELGESFGVELRLSTPGGAPIAEQQWNTMRPQGFLDDIADLRPAPDESEG